MSVRHKAKTQYVEHYEEYVGEEMKPFVAFLATEAPPMEKNASASLTADVTTNLQPTGNKRKVRFWKRITAFFS